MHSYRALFCALLFSLVSFTILQAQSKSEQDAILVTNLDSAKKLYLKGRGQQAISLLKVLLDSHPRNSDLNYCLAILSLKVKKDIMAMRKYYAAAKRKAPNLKDPMQLTEDEIRIYFQPKIINPSDINLQELFKKLDKNLGRKKWNETRIQFNSGKPYLENCSTPLRTTYALYGLRIYDHYDSLMLGLKYFSEIEPEFMYDKQALALYSALKDRWALRYKQFKGEYGNRQRMLQQFTAYLNARDYHMTLLFADLVTAIHKDDSRMLTLIHMNRLEAEIGLNNLGFARKLTNSLKRLFASQNLPQQFSDKLNTLESRLLFKESKIRVGAQIANADSLFLKGNVGSGLDRYEALIKSQKEKFLNTDFIYIRLAQVLREIGYYKEARKELENISAGFSDLVLINSTKDTISKCEQLERVWHTEMQAVKNAYENRNFEKARKQLISFTASSYLRFGLKDSTYSMLIRCYQQTSYTDWARGLASLSNRYMVNGADKRFVAALNKNLGENRLHPAVEYAPYPVNLRFHHKEAVQIELRRMPSATFPTKLSYSSPSIKALALESTALNGGGVYLVKGNEQKSKTNYVLGIGGVLVSILFILAR